MLTPRPSATRVGRPARALVHSVVCFVPSPATLPCPHAAGPAHSLEQHIAGLLRWPCAAKPPPGCRVSALRAMQLLRGGWLVRRPAGQPWSPHASTRRARVSHALTAVDVGRVSRAEEDWGGDSVGGGALGRADAYVGPPRTSPVADTFLSGDRDAPAGHHPWHRIRRRQRRLEGWARHLIRSAAGPCPTLAFMRGTLFQL